MNKIAAYRRSVLGALMAVGVVANISPALAAVEEVEVIAALDPETIWMLIIIAVDIVRSLLA